MVALGDDRIQLLLDHVIAEAEGGAHEEMVAKTVAMFMRVTQDYHTHFVGDEHIKKTIESVVGQSKVMHLTDACVMCSVAFRWNSPTPF